MNAKSLLLLYCTLSSLVLSSSPSLATEDRNLFAITPTILDHPSVKQLKWLTGHWTGKLPNDQIVEENWSLSPNETMFGTQVLSEGRTSSIRLYKIKPQSFLTKFFNDTFVEQASFEGHIEIFYNRDALEVEFRKPNNEIQCKATYELLSSGELKVSWTSSVPGFPNETYVLAKSN